MKNSEENSKEKALLIQKNLSIDHNICIEYTRNIFKFVFVISDDKQVYYYRKSTLKEVKKLENCRNVIQVVEFLKEFVIILEFSNLKIYKIKDNSLNLEKVIQFSDKKFYSENILEPVTLIVKDFTIKVVFKDSRVLFTNYIPKKFKFSLKELMKIEKIQDKNYWNQEIIKEIREKILEVLEKENLLLDSVVEISLSNRIYREVSLNFKKFKEIVHISEISEISDFSEVSDFLNINFDISKEKEQSLYFKSWKNGTVQIFIELEPIGLLSDKRDVKWVLLEEISLFPDEDLDVDVKMVQDLKYPSVIYIYHGYGVHRLNFADWKQVLSSLNHLSLESLSVASSVEWVMTTFDQDLDPVKDFRTFSDFENGYSYTVVTESGKEFHDMLPIKAVNPSVSQRSPNTSLHIQKAQGQKEPFKIPVLEKLGVTRFKANGKYPIGITESLLSDFTEEIVRLRDHVTKIFEVGVELESRLKYILGEHNEATRILSSASSLDSNEELNHRLDAIKKRQKKLEAKSTIILQILLDQTQPELNTAEKSWFSDLKKLAVLIKKKMALSIDDVIFIFIISR